MLNSELKNKIIEIFSSDNIIVDEKLLQEYSHDASSHEAVAPEIVVFPNNTQQISKLLRLANENLIPVTICGARTSLEGNSIPVNQGILLNMMKMNRVVKVSVEDFQVEVEPGILGEELNSELKKHDLFFPAFPASSKIATIGGMIANNAGGMYAVKYQVVKNWVMALEVVLPNGEIIQTGSRSIKSVAGYNLTDLIISSEGTLGVITKAVLKVIPVINEKILIKTSFPSVEKCSAVTLSLLFAALDPAAVEFLDKESIKYINSYKKVNWQEDATLLIELHGAAAEMNRRVEKIRETCEEYHCTSFEKFCETEQISQIWQVRSSVHPAIMQSQKDAVLLPGDVGVPISQIPKFINEVEKLKKENGLTLAVFGHAGDGNFHVWLTYKKGNSDDYQNAKKAAGKIVDIALSLGGTCTAEHGVGIGKREYLRKEHGDSIELMKQIKKVFDPNNILNPGKMF